MADFEYTVRTPSGDKKEGSVTAHDETEAVCILQGRGYLILNLKSSIKKKSQQALVNRVREEVRRRKSTKLDDLRLFFDQVSVLMDASIDIIRVLEIVALQIGSEPLYNAINVMKADISGGASLAESMAKYPKFFPKHVRSIVLIGEQSGELAEVTMCIAENMEKADEVRQKIKKALIYPVILVIFSIIAIAVFLLKIIPTFVGIFADFDIDLPKLTLFVMDLSEFAQRYFFFMVAAVIGFYWVVKKLLSMPKYRFKFDRFILKIPFLGVLLLRSAMVSFTSSLDLMLRNGVLVIEALTLARDSLGNRYLKSLIDHVRDRVKEGSTISSQLEKYPVFPLMLVQMVSVGEESGRLVDMLHKVSEYYNKRVAEAVDRFASIFEPLILMFVGGIIGVLVIAMFLPIFKMAEIGG